MVVYHVVAFKLSNEANLPKLTQSMMALKDSCVRNGTPYVRSIVGGKQTSPEGHCAGMQVVFIVEFENEDDTNYYINDCPAHDAFKKSLPVLGFAGVTVLDFTSGEF